MDELTGLVELLAFQRARADAAEAKLAEAEGKLRALAAADCCHVDCSYLRVEGAQRQKAEAALSAERKAHGELVAALDFLADDDPSMKMYRSFWGKHKGKHAIVPWDDDGPNSEYVDEEFWRDTAADAILAWFRSVKR